MFNEIFPAALELQGGMARMSSLALAEAGWVDAERIQAMAKNRSIWERYEALGRMDGMHVAGLDWLTARMLLVGRLWPDAKPRPVEGSCGPVSLFNQLGD